ncbi:hypothetical protein [Marmoricola sp. RAF53]|uniref:hypothetical protein n=1 Tax=Marmoricola sp. RAF53 TaxID=3233059 RepID=UPI003F9B07FA
MLRAPVTTSVAASLVLFAAPAAIAVGYDGQRTGARIAGDVSISSTTTVLSGRVWDTRADGFCARLRGNWDVPLAPDHGFDVAKACGSGSSAYGIRSDAVDQHARDFEVRAYTEDDHTVIWQGTNGDA